MVAYCSAIWRCRYFWLSLTWMDLRARYRGSVLGMGWSLLHPLAMTAIFTTVFCGIFNMDPKYYAPYVLIGLSCWNYLLNCSLSGCLCFFSAESYIRQHPAPLAIYPLRTVLGLGFHLLIALAVAWVLAVVSFGRWSLAALLSLPATLILFLILGWALAVLSGLMTVYFRDTRHIAEVGFQVLFYITPVFYDADMLQRSQLIGWLRYNPFVPFLDLLRKTLLHGEVPPTMVFAKACVIVGIAAAAAVFALNRLERRLVFHL
jgi:ABC-type polysaccharide/polyol phosphate export permease